VDPRPEHRLRVAITRIKEVTRGRPISGIAHDDEGGDVGSIASDDAIGFDPLPVLRALADHHAPAVVIGQVAGILHGSAELTGDLDLLWSGEPRDAERMVAAFSALRAELFDDDHRPVRQAATAFALPKVLFHAPTAAGDCCTPRLPWGGLDIAGFLDRALSADIGGIRARYLALEDLMAMCRAASRPKDLRRLSRARALAVTGER
jgi:hypothetical protein